MIDARKATAIIGRLAILKFFPADPASRAELVVFVCEMANTLEQVEWLVKRATTLWNEWEGPRELRAVFCSKFHPRDGIEAYSQLERFADGIPSEDAVVNERLLTGRNQAQIAGRVEVYCDDFPTDILGLMEDVAKGAAPPRPVVPKVTEAEIEAIKAQQARNRKES